MLRAPSSRVGTAPGISLHLTRLRSKQTFRAMFGNLKRQWRAFRHSRPGSRFQDRYERSRRARKTGQWYLPFLKIGGALVLIAIGVVLTVIPGPAVLFFMF